MADFTARANCNLRNLSLIVFRKRASGFALIQKERSGFRKAASTDIHIKLCLVEKSRSISVTCLITVDTERRSEQS
jgi:hypothetical protein